MSARHAAWFVAAAIVIAVLPSLILGTAVITTMASVSFGGILSCTSTTSAGHSAAFTGSFGSSPAGARSLSASPDHAREVSIAAAIDGTMVDFAGEQLANAAHILLAGRDRGLAPRDQVIGIMTAIGESSLRVLDHGDAAGPDSRGLFQQRDNGAWGGEDKRMDPYASAGSFFDALAQIAERDALPPSEAAHRVQGNADPDHYAKYWPAAIAVAERISGVSSGLFDDPAGASPDGGAVRDRCAIPGSAASAASVGTGASHVASGGGGWVAPALGGLTDSFGERYHPTEHEWRMHNGVDLAAGGCGGQIWAASSGTVVSAASDSAGNGTITIDHGNGLVTKYLHMEVDGYLVQLGATVSAGQQIAVTGSSGQSTGCHLHFELLVDGVRTDPIPFLAARAVSF